MDSDASPTVIILVTRGDELPKKNYETKLHPTYEITIRIKDKTGKKIASPHQVVKFYDQYYQLHNELLEIGIGKGLSIDIQEEFPPKLKKTGYGLKLTEEELQHRCYLLSKWINAIFKQYFIFPTKAQILISKFLSLDNTDEINEKNKEFILSILRKMKDQTTADGINAFTNNKSTTDPSITTTTSNNNEGLRLTSSVLNQINNNSTYTNNNIITESSPRTNKAQSVNGNLNLQKFIQYDRDTIINKVLCVRVNRGDLLKKTEQNGKQHHTYQILIKMLPANEIVLDEIIKKELDIERYESQIQSVNISISKHFADYRQLKEDLELVHIYCTDAISEASTARNSGYKVIIIDARFPPTLSKSSLGIQLKEDELYERLMLLNNWIGLLLTAFTILPRDGQGLVMGFLDILSYDNDHRNVNTNHLIVLSILKGTYEIPKMSLTVSTEEKTTKQSSLFGFGMTKSSKKSQVIESNKYTELPTTTTTITIESGTGTQLPSPPLYNNNNNNNSTTSSINGNRIEMKVDDNFEYDDQDESHEIIVGAYLAVWIVAGTLLAKKVAGNKTHHSYEINIRILPISEVQTHNQDQYDPIVYENYLKHGPLRIAKMFNDYRDLKILLETYNIFSLEQKNSATEIALKHSSNKTSNNNSNNNNNNNNVPKVIVLEAPFPKTYTKSSLGIKLTERQLIQRAIQLNNWFGSLLKVYSAIPIEAQNHILELLKSHNNETSDGEGLCLNANRRDVVILSMLSGTFVPVLKAIEVIPADHDTNNESLHHTGKQGKGASASSVNTGCACILM